MAKYICVTKCRYGKRYDPGDIADFPEGEKVPHHFKPIDNVEPAEPKNAAKPKKKATE